MNGAVFDCSKLLCTQKSLFLPHLCWKRCHSLCTLFSRLPKSRVGTRRGTLLPFFECLPPNPACCRIGRQRGSITAPFPTTLLQTRRDSFDVTSLSSDHMDAVPTMAIRITRTSWVSHQVTWTPSPCRRLSRLPWAVITPPITTSPPTSWHEVGGERGSVAGPFLSAPSRTTRDRFRVTWLSRVGNAPVQNMHISCSSPCITVLLRCFPL